METKLLATKLFVPPIAPGVVLRPRLVQRLQGVLTSRLTLVSAPAGFGKSTIICQWLKETTIPVAWLSLEEAENDPTRFWAYFIAALRTTKSDVGDASLPVLRSSQPAPIESVLAPLINDLSGVQTDLVVVLDDYHVIKTEAVHGSLTFLLEHLPAKVHMVIATRADPPLPIARFRGNGALIEIRSDDLRFNGGETASLFSGLGVPPLSADNVSALNAKTEGWVVGLKLAALSLRADSDVDAFVTGFAGTQRYVMDYLVEEVLHRQTEDVRSFLLQTSILERLSGFLCDAVMQRNDGRETLFKLDKANLFLVPLDASREWYRYHHLFADLLQNQLDVEFGKQKRDELHRRASRWYEANGFHENAVSHALRAHDWQMAMDLASALNPIAAYGGPTAYNWLNQVPRERLLTHPPACVYYAYALGFTSRFEAQKVFLDAYEKSEAYDPALAGQIALVRTHAAAHQQDPRIEEYARQALSLLPPEDVGWRAITTMHLGIYLLLRGRYNEAEPLLVESCDALHDSGEGFGLSMGLMNLAIVNMMRGRLHRAEELFKRAIPMAERHPNIAGAHLYLGIVYLWWNRLEAAASEMERAIALNPPAGVLGTAHLMNCGVSLGLGNAEAAAESLAKAERVLITENAAPKDRARVVAYRIALDEYRGDSESVSRWLDRLSEYEGFLDDIPSVAMRLLHERRGEAISESLKAQCESFRKEGLCFPVIQIRLEQAVTARESGEALSFLAEALTLGRPEGFIQPFLGWGMPLAPLLRRAISNGIEPEYARKLLTIMEAEDRRRKIAKGEIRLSTLGFGPLSERETEVLRLMAAGLPDRQIAAKLVISLSTAKTHVHRVLEKLNATSRMQAVTRAKQLKLI